MQPYFIDKEEMIGKMLKDITDFVAGNQVTINFQWTDGTQATLNVVCPKSPTKQVAPEPTQELPDPKA